MNRVLNFVLAAIVMADFAKADTPTITDVTAQQRYPWNGKVDISYTLTGDIVAEAKRTASVASLKVMAIDMIAHTTNTATQLSGDLGLAEGTHAIVWDMDTEGLSFKSSNVVFKVSCETTPATYCVIDLSAGSNASSYPVTYLAEPPNGGFNVDEYKTTKLVLRRIEAGSFIMGDDQSDESHRVSLTKPFFYGIFEMTQKQYWLVMGTNPSGFSGDTLPVEKVSYNAIRGTSDGARWPSSSDVDSTSFMGKLRARTGLDFDLPTEAQWEYACRAGTSTTYYWGNSMDGNYAWYANNSSRKTHPVGTKTPNAWGLYDMSGNVWEWCLDWYGNLAYGTDPKGYSSGSYRVPRGGSWYDSTGYLISSYRGGDGPSVANNFGFRLARTILLAEEGVVSAVLCNGQSTTMTVDLTSGTRTAALMEHICYSTDWISGAGVDAQAVIMVNGEKMNSAVGAGFVNWIPSRNGTYIFMHKIMSGETQYGETLTATFLVEGLPTADTPIFSPVSGTTFINVSQDVTITCGTSGATILYTTDGSDPSVNGKAYRGPFSVYESCTVRAIARKDGLVDSDEASITLTRAEGLSEAANLYGYLMETDGTYPWTAVTDVSHDGVSSVRSGTIGNGGMTWLQTSLKKAGTVSFWWRAACEEPDVEDGEDGYYDYGAFMVDGNVAARLAGNDTGWQFFSTNITSGGKHVLRWEYRKDGATTYAPDCLWLDQVQWIPSDGSGYTLTTPEPVPYAWLSGYGLGLDSDFETAAKGATGKRDGNGKALSVWQDYVAGTDPTNVASMFTAGIEMVDGVPQVTWSPNLNTNGIIRTYKVYGSETLDGGGDWQYPTNSLHRFFKVSVEMP